MNVSNDRNFRHAFPNLFQSNGRVIIRNCETHDLTTRTHHLLDLRNGCADVGGVSLSHRLDRDGRATTDLNVFYLNWSRLAHADYFAGEAAAAGGFSGSRFPPIILIRSLLITNTISNNTITNPTC